MSLTSGGLTTESQTELAFDAVIDSLDLFKMHKEVPGTLLQPRPQQRDKSMRIDRILVPTQRLVDLGWTHGVIGVELKRSGVRLGPAIAQAIDYSRSVFTLPGGGFKVWLSYVFIYPAEKEHGDIASILSQNRLGTAVSNSWNLLHFQSGEQNILRVDNMGAAHIGRDSFGTGSGAR